LKRNASGTDFVIQSIIELSHYWKRGSIPVWFRISDCQNFGLYSN